MISGRSTFGRVTFSPFFSRFLFNTPLPVWPQRVGLGGADMSVGSRIKWSGPKIYNLARNWFHCHDSTLGNIQKSLCNVIWSQDLTRLTLGFISKHLATKFLSPSKSWPLVSSVNIVTSTSRLQFHSVLYLCTVNLGKEYPAHFGDFQVWRFDCKAYILKLQ